jgi:predicted negative regulator of RcsB-dependent stress response
MKNIKTFYAVSIVFIVAIIIGFAVTKLYNNYQLKRVNDEADAQHEYYLQEIQKASKPH